MNITIRKATRTDKENIIRLIIALADFENLAPPDDAAKNRLINDAFPPENDTPKFHILLAEDENKAIGYAFYFFTYSSFKARPTLYLEDIFILDEYRSKGIGKSFMDELKKIAVGNNCSRIEWCVLDWNVNAINFYEKLGARHLKEWLYYRIDLNDR